MASVVAMRHGPARHTATHMSLVSRQATAICYGVICHAGFVVGVGAMIAMMYLGMSGSCGRVQPPWRWIANGALLIQFPVVHSLLLMDGGRSLLKRLAPGDFGSRLVTTTYVILSSASLFALFALWSPTGILWWRAEGVVLAFMTGLYGCTWLLLGKAISDAGLALQTGHLGWWALLNDRKPVYPPMPEGGLFRYSRQPIYVAFALTLWTTPTWTPDQLIVAVALTSYCLVGPLLKERRFQRAYGPAFDLYRQRVPYWLPWRRPRSTPALCPPVNDLSIYRTYADNWWDGSQRFLRLMHNLVPSRMRFFSTLVPGWAGMTVLDLGCGGGFMAEALARKGARVVGIDPSAPAVEAARKHARAEGLSIDYRVGSGEHVPLESATADCVVCVDVLEHVESVERVLDEVRRVLKPGGIFLFDTINRTPLATFVLVQLGETMLGGLPRGTHDPAKFIRPPELKAKLVARGFDVGPFYGLAPTGLNRRLDFTMGHFPSLQIMYLGSARVRS